jgi:hypothetical protein
MSNQEATQSTRRAFTTRSVLLIVLIVGLGAGIVAYGVGNTLAANVNQSSQSTQSSTSLVRSYAFGPRGWERPGDADFNRTGTFTSFRAASTINNVSVTGFAIANTNHITVTLAYSGSGTAPAVTVVALAHGLTGSNTVSAGWGSSTTISVSLAGTATLSSSTTCLRVLVVPLTGP